MKIGIIGAGFIGKQHVEAIRRIPGFTVQALCDVDEAAGSAAARELCIPEFYTDYRKMLKNADIQAVHNCTPTNMHFAVNRAVMESGRHIYCEKPLTMTAQESEALVKLAGEKGIHTGVNFNYRNNVMVHEMKDRVGRGDIGDAFMVYGEYLQDWLLYETDYDWRMDPEKGGRSRALSDIGSHCFDTAQYVLGRPIEAVYAKLIRLYPSRKKPVHPTGTFGKSGPGAGTYEKVPVLSEDAAFIMAEFAGGIHGLFRISQVSAGAKNGLALTVDGTASSLTWRQERADHLLTGRRESGNEDIFAAPQYVGEYAAPWASLPAGHSPGWADAFRNGIASFYRNIENPSAPSIHARFEEGCQVMKLVEACLESSEEDRWVQVKP